MQSNESNHQPTLVDISTDSIEVKYQALQQAVEDFIGLMQHELNECHLGNAKYSDFVDTLDDRLYDLQKELNS